MRNIQLPKYRESNPDMDNKLNQWLAVIDDTDRGKIEMAKAKNNIIKEAEVEIKYFTASEEAQYLEDMRDLWESDRATELSYAREERWKEIQNKNRQETIRKKSWHRRNHGTDRINGRRNQKNKISNIKC